MLILKSWLNDYINFDFTDAVLSDKLSSTGTLVDEYSLTIDPKIVVAKIIEIEKHQSADKLKVVKVIDGESEYQIVCGAPNIEIGQIVPLAKIGAKLGKIEIFKASIRGVESSGMLCSEKELEIGDDHSGIMILSNDYDLGKPLAEYLGNETMFKLEITPNRGDCLSHLGIAREIGAIVKKTIKKPPIELKQSGQSASSKLLLLVKDSKLCPNYYARVITNVKIKPSPEWIKNRLIKCGITPINNVVDVTNYIMLDLGQPLHAFDLSGIEGNKIIVRRAKKGEKIVTIDHTDRNLSGSEIVIADTKKPIAIAGLMGGAESEIKETTQDVVIEAAQFDRRAIRASSKNFNLVTEASYRFERGIDAGLIEYAINKAVNLIAQLSGGTILSQIVKHETNALPTTVKFNYKDINNLLNTCLKEHEIDQILLSLGFKIDGNICVVPSFRADVTIWQDLAEEVMRFYGLDNILDCKIPKTKPPIASTYFIKEQIKDKLVNLGFSEVFNYPFLSEGGLITIQNPIQPESRYLRDSLLSELYKNIATNPSFDQILLFEIGNAFTENGENSNLAVVVSGKDSERIIKEATKTISNYLNIPINEIQIQSKTRKELNEYKIKKPFVYSFEINLSKLLKNHTIKNVSRCLKENNNKIFYRPISKFPSVTRDLAFVVDKTISSTAVTNSIYEISKLINRVELFDEYASEKLGKNNKNIAFHLNILSTDHTLKDDEANVIIDQIIKNTESKFSAKLRL